MRKGKDKEMEIRVEEVKLPEKIQWNYEELKAQLGKKLQDYKGLVVTEDAIAPAKKDVADLRKLSKAINDDRIARQREYMKPFELYKSQCGDLIMMIDSVVKEIDDQIKGFDEKQKQEKLEKIKELFSSFGFQPWVSFDRLYDPKWLNKSTTMKSIEEELRTRQHSIGEDVLAIDKLPEFSFEALEVYKTTLSLTEAIAEGQRLADIQKRKQAAEAEKAAQTQTAAPTNPSDDLLSAAASKDIPEPGEWVKFEACLTMDAALKLKRFFHENGIQFRAI